MKEFSSAFYRKTLDALASTIAIVDHQGVIVYVNRQWREFARENACLDSAFLVGRSYLEACDQAAANGDDYGSRAGSGIRAVLAGEAEQFHMEYPCHSPAEQRWFMMSATLFAESQQQFLVVAHENITQRKLAELKVEELASTDGLTEIANRRAFEEFLENEWKRGMRYQHPLSLAMVDVDFFKGFNDALGHPAGDACLREVAALLGHLAQRPSDMAARYGGEEFVLLWGNTPPCQARALALRLQEDLSALGIEHPNSEVSDSVTVSIGLASMIPAKGQEAGELIARADRMLYLAKENGRNRVECWEESSQ